ncbi:MAG: phospholipase [Frankiales bacterium]|jgi:hypothetical protein|nr:phospholipase [Frankiales bacterium]
MSAPCPHGSVFCGRGSPGIDSRWNSQVSIGRAVLDLLALPLLGVLRLDQATSLADLVNPAATTRASPTPPPAPVPPPPSGTSTLVGPIVLRDDSTLAAPTTDPYICDDDPRPGCLPEIGDVAQEALLVAEDTMRQPETAARTAPS